MMNRSKRDISRREIRDSLRRFDFMRDGGRIEHNGVMRRMQAEDRNRAFRMQTREQLVRRLSEVSA